MPHVTQVSEGEGQDAGAGSRRLCSLTPLGRAFWVPSRGQPSVSVFQAGTPVWRFQGELPDLDTDKVIPGLTIREKGIIT